MPLLGLIEAGSRRSGIVSEARHGAKEKRGPLWQRATLPRGSYLGYRPQIRLAYRLAAARLPKRERMRPPRPARPVPSSISELGSGVGAIVTSSTRANAGS